MAETFSIGTLANAGGVGVETVRYYERLKLLKQPARPHGAIRKYGEGDLERLRFIKRAQSAGFTLDEVATLLGFLRDQSCHGTREAISAKLGEVEDRLAALNTLRDDLKGMLGRCDTIGSDTYCPALDELAGRKR